jgi:hypothetical protein
VIDRTGLPLRATNGDARRAMEGFRLMDTSSFEQVSRDEFNIALEESKASSIFRQQFARFEPQYYEDDRTAWSIARGSRY